jgi:hypothetical protein
MRVPELVLCHARRQRVLASVGEQLVGALEHALVDVVLVAPAAPRRREQHIVEVRAGAGERAWTAGPP